MNQKEFDKKLLKDSTDIIAFWIHKGLRWSEDPASGKAWNAISELEETNEHDEWGEIVENAVKEVMPLIKRRIRKELKK